MILRRGRIWLQCAGLVLILAVSLVTKIPLVHATPDPYLTGGSSVTGYNGTATPITDLQIAGTGNPTVPVKLRVTNGTLAMSTTTGLTFSGSSSGSTLQFSGTLTNVNTALATLTYTRNSTGSDTLEASLVASGEVFFPDNGHLYEYVSYTATWGNARTNAQSRTKYGATGYLTTITSSAENTFVADRLLNAGWMGASDSGSEGDWKWVTGPESGTSFWSGNYNGGPVSSRYSNWNTSEPNDSGSNEDCGQFLSGTSGKWNDLPCSGTTLPGYVVEYGSDASPIDISSKNVAITTLAPNNYPNSPSSLSPTTVTDGSWSVDNNPTLNFNLSDPDGSNTVRYQIQIDDSSDFSSPAVDYTSPLATQGNHSFTVGQNAGSGTYAVGSNGQSLNDGTYYWRVKASDQVGASSSYALANGGAVAFGVDTTSPQYPGAPTTASPGEPTNDDTPTWTWDASMDFGSGLSGTYTIEWSQDNLFANAVQSATSNTTNFTHTVSLAEGQWYARVTTSDNAGNTRTSSLGSVLIDTTNPALQTTQPTNNNKSIPYEAPLSLVLQFTEDITKGIGNIKVYSKSNNTLFESVAITSSSATISNDTLSVELTQKMDPSTSYYVLIDTGAITDTAGNIFAGIITNSTFGFSTKAKPVETAKPPSQQPASTQNEEVLYTYGTPLVNQTDADSNSSPQNGIIVLNEFNEYNYGDGKQINLSPRQVIYFDVSVTGGAERHSATIKEVGVNYAVVTLASTPRDVTLQVGETKSYDVTEDGQNDIEMTLNSISGGVADITFRQLLDIAGTSSGTPNAQAKSFNYWPYFLMATLTIMLLYVARRKKRSKT